MKNKILFKKLSLILTKILHCFPSAQWPNRDAFYHLCSVEIHKVKGYPTGTNQDEKNTK